MIEIISSIYSVIGSLSSLLSIFAYVAVGYGLYNMAISCGLKNPWMAWIPFCNIYTLGRVADHACTRNEGRTTTYRKKLLGLSIAQSAVIVVTIIATVVAIVLAIIEGFSGTVPNADFLLENTEQLVEVIVSAFLSVSVVWLALVVVAIVYTVFYYIAAYKVFKLFSEKNAVLYTVLSIFFSNIALPIIFLILAKKQPNYVRPEGSDEAFYTL